MHPRVLCIFLSLTRPRRFLSSLTTGCSCTDLRSAVLSLSFIRKNSRFLLPMPSPHLRVALAVCFSLQRQRVSSLPTPRLRAALRLFPRLHRNRFCFCLTRFAKLCVSSSSSQPFFLRFTLFALGFAFFSSLPRNRFSFASTLFARFDAILCLLSIHDFYFLWEFSFKQFRL